MQFLGNLIARRNLLIVSISFWAKRMTHVDNRAGIGNAQTVLLVEDEILVRLAISDYLRECGFKVIEATNGDEALTVLREPDIRVDIVLCDVEMPGHTDGFGLSQWLRTNKPRTPIILAGSSARAVDAAGDLCESGPMLAKPYDPQILLDGIKRMLAEAERAIDDATTEAGKESLPVGERPGKPEKLRLAALER
jgi:DNA-binding response OmpR family regulator